MRARTIAFRSDGLDLSGELVVPERSHAALVLCHGLPSARPAAFDDPGYAGLAREFAARGYSSLWFNFRGCRDAPGDFSAGGWCSDLDAALDALAAQPDVQRLPRAILGSSAGGATALTVGARRADVALVATLAAVASFRFGDVVTDVDALLHELRNVGVIRDPAFPHDTAEWVAELEENAADRHIGSIAPRPVLLVHGDADEVVPYPHAERLFEAAGAPKELVRIPGGAHQLRRDHRAVDAVADWLERHLSRS